MDLPSGDQTGERSCAAGCAGEVPRVSLLGGNSDDLATILEYRALARGGDIGRANHLGVAHIPGSSLSQVRCHANSQALRFLRARIEIVQVPSLLVDDSPGAGRGAVDRETIMAGQTHHVLRLEVIRVKIELAVSIREEVNRCTDPHRLGIVAAPRGFGDFLVREVRKFENPDPRSRAAAVILPLAEPLTKGGVRQVRTIRRDRPHVAGGNRQRLRHPTVDADREKLRVPLREDRALGSEEYLAFGREASDDVVSGVPCQTLWLAPSTGTI